VRRALLGVAGVAIAAAALIALVLAFTARDDAEVSGPQGPGELQRDLGARHLRAGEHVPLEGLTDPPTSGPHHPAAVPRDRARLDPDEILHALELGNVILFYEGERPPPALAALQEELTGPFDPELAAAGQAVILAPRPGAGPVTAAAWRRLLRGADPGAATVREFAEAWLGRGAAG
jgi:hypothetical protein